MIGILILASCKKDDDYDLSKDYLPLQVGNYWEFQEWTDSIDNIVKMDGNDYYRVLYRRYNANSYSDTVYYRKTSNGKVYMRSKFYPEDILRFDLNAQIGQTWEYINTWNLDRPWKVTLQSKIDKIQLGNDQIKYCYRYYFDIPISIDDESCRWLAPGIGFVLESNAQWTSGAYRLTKVRINGVERQF